MNTSVKNSFQGIRAAIIDLDGTMVDTAPDFQVAINRMRDELHLAPLALDTIVDFVGKGSENLMRRVLGVDFEKNEVESRFDHALERYQHHYLQINGDHSKLYAGVHEGLVAMKKGGVRLACVTNKPIAFARPLLEKKGLIDLFEVIYGGDSLAHKKPHPLPMLTVCNDFDLQPAQVVAIGDSSNDSEAARAAGCRVLTVPYGYNHGQPVQTIDTDGIVESLLDAASLIVH
ncbi:Gph Predicted phosphatases [Oxalobacteraceae bacterium]